MNSGHMGDASAAGGRTFGARGRTLCTAVCAMSWRGEWFHQLSTLFFRHSRRVDFMKMGKESEKNRKNAPQPESLEKKTKGA
jgi:hypothetical protein